MKVCRIVNGHGNFLKEDDGQGNLTWTTNKNEAHTWEQREACSEYLYFVFKDFPDSEIQIEDIAG